MGYDELWIWILWFVLGFLLGCVTGVGLVEWLRWLALRGR